MRMILDGMGGDHAPASVVEGAILAMKEMEHEIVIVGQQELIEAELKKHKYDHQRLSVVDAREVITNDDAPVRAVRTKKDSSIVRGINMVKEGEGDIFISAGSTGALLCGGLCSQIRRAFTARCEFCDTGRGKGRFDWWKRCGQDDLAARYPQTGKSDDTD